MEDIPFPIPKTVKKENIGIYFCQKCRAKKYAKTVGPGSKVVIGENAKKFILYSYYLKHLTFGKIVDFLKDGFQFTISEGEIQNILAESAKKLEPEHLEIRKRIRSNPVVHMDETGWNMNGEKYYAWEMVSGENVSFELKDTRGKGVAEKLLGKNFSGTLMSDFYGAYKNLCQNHAVCWVHLLRDFHQLASNKNIPQKYRFLLQADYEKISKIYLELKEIQPKSLKFWEKELKKFQQKLQNFAGLNSRDPPIRKLKNLKKRILQYEKELLVSLTKDGIPLHKNQAEQALRPLVIKRKISFGSRSKKALKIFGINMSVLTTLWRTDRKNFFQNLSNVVKLN